MSNYIILLLLLNILMTTNSSVEFTFSIKRMGDLDVSEKNTCTMTFNTEEYAKIIEDKEYNDVMFDFYSLSEFIIFKKDINGLLAYNSCGNKDIPCPNLSKGDIIANYNGIMIMLKDSSDIYGETIGQANITEIKEILEKENRIMNLVVEFVSDHSDGFKLIINYCFNNPNHEFGMILNNQFLSLENNRTDGSNCYWTETITNTTGTIEFKTIIFKDYYSNKVAVMKKIDLNNFTSDDQCTKSDSALSCNFTGLTN